MKFFGRIFSIILALAFAVGCICFSGCGDNNKTDASATETPAPTLDWNTTPDPALFELDEDGHFENEVFSVTWPSILSYKYALLSNSCIYEGYTEDGHKLVLSYTLDEGGEYASEIGGYTAETYQQFLNSANDEDKGDTYFVDEFAYMKIDGIEQDLEGYDFRSDESLTDYKIHSSSGAFPMGEDNKVPQPNSEELIMFQSDTTYQQTPNL